MASKRDRFIFHLEQLAKERGLECRVERWRGKGGHALIWGGSRVTTLPARGSDPKTAKKVLRALALDS